MISYEVAGNNQTNMREEKACVAEQKWEHKKKVNVEMRKKWKRQNPL
jgi:hypothetical protein